MFLVISCIINKPNFYFLCFPFSLLDLLLDLDLEEDEDLFCFDLYFEEDSEELLLFFCFFLNQNKSYNYYWNKKTQNLCLFGGSVWAKFGLFFFSSKACAVAKKIKNKFFYNYIFKIPLINPRVHCICLPFNHALFISNAY